VACCRLPQSPDRDGEQAVTKRYGGFAIVEHHTTGKTFCNCRLQLVQPLEISRCDGCCSFYLYPGQALAISFKYQVYLDTILVPEVLKGNLLFMPACLSAQFLKNKTFKKLPQKCPVVG